jgi:two-component system, chemotaxis family, protein-glutamate methylesterase/glutaminase
MSSTNRVVVVDDSALMRQTVSDALRSIRGLEIVATAASGPEAVKLIAEHRPDIVSLDIELPGMNGLDVLRQAMRSNPTRIVLVSAHTTAGAETTIEGLALGALDFVPKPSIEEGIDVFRVRLRRTFRAALSAKLPQFDSASPPASSTQASPLRPTSLAVIASSTGGPQALFEFFSSFTKAPAFPIAVVQHMPPKFTEKMAERLNRAGPISVSEAADGDRLRPSSALIAPGHAHMEIHGDTVHLTDDAPIGGLRPRADITLASAAERFGKNVTGMVMTGMGSDGLIGCRDVKRQGGQVIAQDGASSTVDGMPRAVRNAGLADRVGPPAFLAKVLERTPAQVHGQITAGIR